MRIWFQLPRPSREPQVDRCCAHCRHRKVHLHQHQRTRSVVDWKVDTIHQVRVKCPACGKTGTRHPAGIHPGRHRSDAVAAFGILLYALGLSYGAVAAAIRALVRAGSKSTIYRDVQRAGRQAQQLHQRRRGQAVRLVGVDGTGQKIKGGHAGVALAVDAESQVLLAVELVEEENEAEVKRFVRRLCRDYEIRSLITDEHPSYAAAVRSRSVPVEHRLCQAHWKKSKQLRIRKLLAQAGRRGYRRWVKDLEALRELVRHQPRDGPADVFEIHRRYLRYPAPGPGRHWSLGYHLRMLSLHLLETWHRLGAESQPTNNTAERLIGLLLKIRSRTMRGFARPENIPKFVHLMAYLWENRHACDLRALC